LLRRISRLCCGLDDEEMGVLGLGKGKGGCVVIGVAMEIEGVREEEWEGDCILVGVVVMWWVRSE